MLNTYTVKVFKTGSDWSQLRDDDDERVKASSLGGT